MVTFVLRRSFYVVTKVDEDIDGRDQIRESGEIMTARVMTISDMKI